MNNLVQLRDVLFVLRCMFSAGLAYWLGSMLGLEYPSWASVTAIIVSQESLNDTESAAMRRLVATMLGVFIGIAISVPLRYLGAGPLIQMSLGVAVASIVARRWPEFKVAMWTVPIIFFAGRAEIDPVTFGLWRGAEVLVGGLAGAAVHFLTEQLYGLLQNRARRRG